MFSKLALLALLAAPLAAQQPCRVTVAHDSIIARPVRRDTSCALHVTVKTAAPRDTVVPPTPPTPDTGYQTPNLLVNASFEQGWDGFTDWTGVNAPKSVTRSKTAAAEGSWSVLRTITPTPTGDVGSQFMYIFGNEKRVWMRFSFKLTTEVSTIMKFARFYDPTNNTNLGGFFIEAGNSLLTWGWDQEDGAITTPINIGASKRCSTGNSIRWKWTTGAMAIRPAFPAPRSGSTASRCRIQTARRTSNTRAAATTATGTTADSMRANGRTR